jgi:hypothetical protein
MSDKFFKITTIIIESLPYIKVVNNELIVPYILYNELKNYKNKQDYDIIIEDFRLKYNLKKNYIIRT